MKILKLVGSFNDKTEKISTEDSPLGPVTVYRYRQAYGFSPKWLWFWDWELLDKHYQMNDPNLMAVYDEIRELAKDHDVLYHAVGDMMHPEFIKSLDIRKIYCVDGEPASSRMLSHPVVHAYDFALTCSTNYNETSTCVEQLINHGAPDAAHVICGTKYPKKHEAWKNKIDGDKDIDLIFLGGDMSVCKPTLAYPPNKYLVIDYILRNIPGIKYHVAEWKDIDSANELYKRSKIGIVLHGPSQYGIGNSQRLYDLAAAGVMIISDGLHYGIGDIFKLEKEINAFDWRDIDRAVYLVRAYLESDADRIRLAESARKRCFKEYRNDDDDNWMIRGIKLATKDSISSR
jgi:hypothetical protein